MEHASESVGFQNIQQNDSSGTQFSFVWKVEGQNDLIYGDCGTTPSDKILSFDLDSTLIKTKSGAKFPKDSDDWVLFNEKVIPCLYEYYNSGYKLVIFSNQGGIEKGHTQVQTVQDKLQKIVKFIGIPIQVLIAPKQNGFRKPFPGMWTFFVQNLNGNVKVNLRESIYCGDAAGRPRATTRSPDFSDTDYRFGLNIGLKFRTPEALFNKEDMILPMIEFDPRKLKATGSVIRDKDVSQLRMEGKEMIIFVGPPSSGKTTFWRNYLEDYVQITEEALKGGKSVVINNSNPEIQTRKEYINLAQKYNYPVRCFYFEVSKELVFHLDTLKIAKPEEINSRVGKIPVHVFFKRLEMPTTEEGFVAVETIEFIPGPFKNKEEEMLFYSYS